MMLSVLQSHEHDLAYIAEKCETTAHARQEVKLEKYLEESEDSLQKIEHDVNQILQSVSEQERIAIQTPEIE